MATIGWKGGTPGNYLFGAGNAWVGGIAPTGTDLAVFNAASLGPYSVEVDLNQVVGGIEVDQDKVALEGTLTTLVAIDYAPLTVSNDGEVDLYGDFLANQTVGVTAGSLAASVSNGLMLLENGGSLDVSQLNIGTAGTLELVAQDSGHIGGQITGTLAVSGGTIGLLGPGPTASSLSLYNPIRVSNSGTISDNSANATFYLYDTATGTGDLTFAGPGAFDLFGDFSGVSGAMTLQSGDLYLPYAASVSNGPLFLT